MKGWLIVLFMLSSLMGCQQKDVGVGLPTADALYRRWQLTQVSYDGQPTDHEQYITVVTFPRDGSFRGNQPKDARWCCRPIAFEGTDAAIRFIWDTSDPICALINCRMSPLWADIDWQITTLTNEQLVLMSDKRTLLFRPSP